MERVCQNLIANAVEAMPDGGSVSIRAERKESEEVVSVEDTAAIFGPRIRTAVLDS
jgi:signal transduction histidine kinase